MSREQANGDRGAGPAPAGAGRRLLAALGRLHQDDSGAATTEYVLILALIVLPIALMFPMFMSMIKTYAGRMTSLMGTPFP